MNKTCENCDFSYMGYGESSCNYTLRCSHYEQMVDDDHTCKHWRNNKKELEAVEINLKKLRNAACMVFDAEDAMAWQVVRNHIKNVLKDIGHE